MYGTSNVKLFNRNKHAKRTNYIMSRVISVQFTEYCVHTQRGQDRAPATLPSMGDSFRGLTYVRIFWHYGSVQTNQKNRN